MLELIAALLSSVPLQTLSPMMVLAPSCSSLYAKHSLFHCSLLKCHVFSFSAPRLIHLAGCGVCSPGSGIYIHPAPPAQKCTRNLC